MDSTQNSSNIVPYPKFLMMSSTDPKLDLSKQNMFIVEKALVGIIGQEHNCQVKALRSGHLLIEVDQKHKAETLLDLKQLHTFPVTVEPHNELNSCKGTVYCENLRGMTDIEILTELKEQNPNVTEIYRIKRKDGQDLVDTDKFIVTFNLRTLPDEMKIGYMITKVKTYIPNPRRCFKCQKYGHGKSKCQGQVICARCGQAGHEYCDAPAECYHCKQPHDTTSKECPKYQLERKVQEQKALYNITMYDARKKVYESCHDLVRQLPGNSNKNKKTWSEVTASGSSKTSTVADDFEDRLKRIEDCLENITLILASLSPTLFASPGLLEKFIKTNETTNQESDMEAQDTPNIQSILNQRKPKRAISNSSDENNPQSEQLAKKVPSSTQEDSNVCASPSLGGPSATKGSETPQAPTDRGVKKGAEGARAPSSNPGHDVKGGVKTGSSAPNKESKGVVSNKANNGKFNKSGQPNRKLIR